MSKWTDPAILARAPHLRTGRSKGVRAAVREAKRIAARNRDLFTLPERRRSQRAAGRDEPPAGSGAGGSAAPAGS